MMSDHPLLRLERTGSAVRRRGVIAAHLRALDERLLAVPIGLWIAFFACALVFVGAPEIDLAVSRLFYTPGFGFTFRGDPLERLLYHSVEWLTLWGSLGLIAAWAYGCFVRPVRWRLAGRDLGLLLLVLALGPGLIVNALLKEHWGRARPVAIVEFGGERAFSPAFVPTTQGGRSFSSGHAAAAFFWTAVALLAKRRRRLWLTAAICYGVLIGLIRIAAGGHFLSDVVTSFFIVLILTLVLRNLFYQPMPATMASPRPPRASPALGESR